MLETHEEETVTRFRLAALVVALIATIACGDSYPYVELTDLSSNPSSHIGDVDTAGHPLVQISADGHEASGELCPEAVVGSHCIDVHQVCQGSTMSDNPVDTIELSGKFTIVRGRPHLEAEC